MDTDHSYWSWIQRDSAAEIYYIKLCYVTLCYVMLCCVMLYYIMLCYVVLCCVVLCCVVLCYFILCYFMLYYIILYYIILYYIILYYIILYYIIYGHINILMSETCWAYKKWNNIASDNKLVFYSSVIKTVTNNLWGISMFRVYIRCHVYKVEIWM